MLTEGVRQAGGRRGGRVRRVREKKRKNESREKKFSIEFLCVLVKRMK